MHNKSSLALSIASICLCLSLPTFAQSTKAVPNAAQRGERVALHMVPANVSLDEEIDANKVAVGYRFKATLNGKVRLKNGVTLPSGTEILGEVAADDMQLAGKSKIALRFTQAVLKNGTAMPIRATIVAAFQPDSAALEDEGDSGSAQIPNNWSDGTLAVDQVGGLGPHVDLHSRIVSRNSGVFIANDKHTVKLPEGSELSLALSARAQQKASLR